MRTGRYAGRVALQLLLAGCAATGRGGDPSPGPAPAPAAAITSLLGRPLEAEPLDPDLRDERERQLEAALAELEAAPRDEQRIIWVGRRQAYLGRYQEAIQTFTMGLRHHPESPRLLRHRGHRFLTLRRFQEAERDLSRAARLVWEMRDEVEPDGLPNALNQPRSTLKTNVHYHLALAHYLQGAFEPAAAHWSRCLELSTNDDMAVAARYWLYLSLQRLGRPRDAATVLEPVRVEMDVIENHAYHELLLLYKGELPPDRVLDLEAPDAVESATRAYGLANWRLLQGDRAGAEELLQRIVHGPGWAAFGFIAAEADLAEPERLDRAAGA